MIFEAKKDKIFSIIFYGLILCFGFLLVLILKGQIVANSLSLVVDISILMLLIWIWYGSDYKINNTVLSLRYGPFKKNIPIRSITKISIGKTKWVGNNFGLSMGGLIIHYSSDSVVYLTPENVENFQKQLKLVNKKIVIHKK